MIITPKPETGSPTLNAQRSGHRAAAQCDGVCAGELLRHADRADAALLEWPAEPLSEPWHTSLPTCLDRQHALTSSVILAALPTLRSVPVFAVYARLASPRCAGHGSVSGAITTHIYNRDDKALPITFLDSLPWSVQSAVPQHFGHSCIVISQRDTAAALSKPHLRVSFADLVSGWHLGTYVCTGTPCGPRLGAASSRRQRCRQGMAQ